jgi:hypothetical protein
MRVSDDLFDAPARWQGEAMIRCKEDHEMSVA